ncbi:MAG: LbtU family siderophore porin [Pseudomonadota bacterium]
MKLKTIVASLVALGLSAPVLAAPYYMDTSYQLDVMRDQMNKFDMILDQNQPGGFDQPCGWTCRINLSGWINTDVYLANRPPVFLTFNPTFNPAVAVTTPDNPVIIPATGRASDLVLNNANLFVDARVNNWVTAMMSLVYSSFTGIPGSTGPYNIANSLFVYHPLHRTNLDTAYATIGNFQASPIYFRVGKAYAPFGQYDPYAFVQSENPTQLFTEINQTLAQLGFILPGGFYGSAYTFAGNPKRSDGGSTRRIQNGGVDLGYGWKMWNSKINVDAGWLANIADSNFLSSYYLNSIIEGTSVPGLPNEKVPAWDVNADLTFGPFDINGHYISTTRSLANPVFLSGFTPSTVLGGQPVEPGFLGKPNVWGLEAGLTFPVKAHQSRVALGWQQTTHLATFLPKKRFYIDYLVNMAKWFDMGIAVVQDRDYGVGEGALTSDIPAAGTIVHQGATNGKSTFGQLRASIKFA